jgi:hypothetical protein
MNIEVGNEIRLIRPMGVFDNIGEICEVTNVTEDGVISFRFGGRHLGCMSYDEFEKYFELVKKIEEQVDDIEEESLEARELRELFEWCQKNDKPFYPSLYYSVVAQRTDVTKPILGMYTNRLCLMQFRNKKFKDSDFSLMKIMA